MRSAAVSPRADADQTPRRELLEPIQRVSVRRGRVVLSSGQQSDFHLDLRQTLMDLPL
jgi:orotate phosphoribosyltransferase